jgi:hypothetical protein
MLRQIARNSIQQTTRCISLIQSPRISFVKAGIAPFHHISQPTVGNRFFSFSPTRFNENPSYTIT